MVIRNLYKKVMMMSACLIIIGILISIIGFWIGDFELSHFKINENHKWYQTINIDDHFFSFQMGYKK